MTTMTSEATTPSPFARDPFYCLGIADAYDEYTAGEDIHALKQRAEEMLDAAPTGLVPANLYVCGYATAIAGLLNGHIAQIGAQTEVAHRWLTEQERAA
ncbi:hypothetical protein D0Z67_29400 (plasmid) [Streptomyces seoulensis]|uniref:Uncharacterized protein n=1 Tax=Streptomyces seoulensis TaxID=73044 RepID=A0A4V1A0G3_STRSO|nr:hypothetical protein [Streptomyces seoulensis]QBJ94486.1 hypothetical protein D0Z67_29400 [Streptomyces seoulensis]